MLQLFIVTCRIKAGSAVSNQNTNPNDITEKINVATKSILFSMPLAVAWKTTNIAEKIMIEIMLSISKRFSLLMDLPIFHKTNEGIIMKNKTVSMIETKGPKTILPIDSDSPKAVVAKTAAIGVVVINL